MENEEKKQPGNLNYAVGIPKPQNKNKSFTSVEIHRAGRENVGRCEDKEEIKQNIYTVLVNMLSTLWTTDSKRT